MTFITRLVESKGLVIEKHVSYPTGFKCIFLVGGPMNICVPPEPLVETEFGMRPISTVERGQKVWAVNEDGINTLTEIHKVLTHTDDETKVPSTCANDVPLIWKISYSLVLF